MDKHPPHTQHMGALLCGHATPDSHFQLALPLRRPPLHVNPNQSLQQLRTSPDTLQSHALNGTSFRLDNPNKSPGEESEYEVALDLRGRKHVEECHEKAGFYRLLGGHSAQYTFPMPGKESADALRVSLRNHLPFNLITDEYGVIKPLEDVSNNHLPNLQAQLWRELPRDHNARISSPAAPLSFALGPYKPLQNANLLPTTNRTSNDDRRLAHEIMTIAELLTCNHVFILRDGKKSGCAKLACRLRNDEDVSHIKIISLEPLLDWSTVSLAHDILISRGRITVYHRNGEKLKNPLWAEATRKLAPENPLAYCVDCLEHLMSKRTKAWKYLDQREIADRKGIQPIERPNHIDFPTKKHNVTAVHNGVRPQPEFARQVPKSNRQPTNGIDLSISISRTYPQLDGTCPSPFLKENRILSGSIQPSQNQSEADGSIAQGWPGMETHNETTSYTMPGLSLAGSSSATFSQATPSINTNSTMPSNPFRQPPTLSLGQLAVDQPRPFTMPRQGMKRAFGRMIDTNAAPAVATGLDNINFYDPTKQKTPSKPRAKPRSLAVKRKVSSPSTSRSTSVSPTKSKPAKPTPAIEPLFAKPFIIAPEDVPDEYAPEVYYTFRKQAPTSSQHICICLCPPPSNTDTIRIVQCSNKDCDIQWYHYACLDKIAKLKACHGTFLCRRCEHEQECAEKRKRCKAEDGVKKSWLPWSGKEIADAYPGPGGVLGVPYPYGLGKKRDFEDEMAKVEEPPRVTPMVTILTRMGYAEAQPPALTGALRELHRPRHVDEEEDGYEEEDWYEGEDEYWECEEGYGEDEEEDGEDEEDGEELGEEENMDEPAPKRARLC